MTKDLESRATINARTTITTINTPGIVVFRSISLAFINSSPSLVEVSPWFCEIQYDPLHTS
jgi:hypothetical protein